MRRVLIVGAVSAIAEATARLFAAEGGRLYLVARSAEKVEAVAADLRTRGAAQVATQVMDATDYGQHATLIEQAANTLGGLDIALIAYGTLSDQKACEASFELTRQELEINALSVISLLTYLANYFHQQGHGSIAVISSVAGDRGRQSNYVYGTAKAALTTFLQGLRNRLHPAGVHVLTVKPGFVDTPMTTEFQKGLLWVGPETIAKGIYNAIERRKNVVYLPWFWFWIMLVIRSIPESIFKTLKL